MLCRLCRCCFTWLIHLILLCWGLIWMPYVDLPFILLVSRHNFFPFLTRANCSPQLGWGARALYKCHGELSRSLLIFFNGLIHGLGVYLPFCPIEISPDSVKSSMCSHPKRQRNPPLHSHLLSSRVEIQLFLSCQLTSSGWGLRGCQMFCFFPWVLPSNFFSSRLCLFPYGSLFTIFFKSTLNISAHFFF